MNKPTTYAAAAKVAEPVDGETLAELMRADSNPDIFPRPKGQRKIAWNVRFMYDEDGGWNEALTVRFERCNRRGFQTIGFVFRFDQPIFHFERLGRIVRWEG